MALAKAMGARFVVVTTEETDDLKFRENPPDRCYYCKTELFGKLEQIAEQEGIPWIADGTITDDVGDFRPGMRAKDEKNVRSPLLEAGFSKADVRELSSIWIFRRGTSPRSPVSPRGSRTAQASQEKTSPASTAPRHSFGTRGSGSSVSASMTRRPRGSRWAHRRSRASWTEPSASDREASESPRIHVRHARSAGIPHRLDE